jgi:hypothetical protein
MPYVVPTAALSYAAYDTAKELKKKNSSKLKLASNALLGSLAAAYAYNNYRGIPYSPDLAFEGVEGRTEEELNQEMEQINLDPTLDGQQISEIETAEERASSLRDIEIAEERASTFGTPLLDLPPMSRSQTPMSRSQTPRNQSPAVFSPSPEIISPTATLVRPRAQFNAMAELPSPPPGYIPVYPTKPLSQMTMEDMKDLARANKWKGFSGLGYDQLRQFTETYMNEYLPLD